MLLLFEWQHGGNRPEPKRIGKRAFGRFQDETRDEIQIEEPAETKETKRHEVEKARARALQIEAMGTEQTECKPQEVGDFRAAWTEVGACGGAEVVDTDDTTANKIENTGDRDVDDATGVPKVVCWFGTVCRVMHADHLARGAASRRSRDNVLSPFASLTRMIAASCPVRAAVERSSTDTSIRAISPIFSTGA